MGSGLASRDVTMKRIVALIVTAKRFDDFSRGGHREPTECLPSNPQLSITGLFQLVTDF